jgi:universal stress protein A
MTVKPLPKRGVVLTLAQDEEKLLAPPTAPFALRTILVPIDFSECSKKALLYALPLARQFGARLILLHVAQFQYAGSENDDLELPVLERKVVAAYQQRLNDLAKDELRTCLSKPVVCIGRVVPDIIAIAKSENADVIVISTHGCSGKDSILGSTTQRVVRHAPCPVLVVREREHEFVRPTGEMK